MDLELLLRTPPKLHGPGAGVSTIAFARKRTQHTCVVPDSLVVRRIRQYCRSARVRLDTVNFVVGRSEYALPRLRSSAYEFAPIDGRHGFPAPFIDWFYLADRLRQGGIVMVDDTWIWTCHVLARFLDADAGWQRFGLLPTSAVFVKKRDDPHHAEWVEQPFVYRQSRAARFYPAKARSRRGKRR